MDRSHFKHSEACFKNSLRCLHNDTTLASKDIHVGRPPSPVEFQQNFKCFMFDVVEKNCTFTLTSNCDRKAQYHLYILNDPFVSSCSLQRKDDKYYYSSTPVNCHFPTSDGVNLRLEASNSIGNRTMHYTVNYDLVKPREVYSPEVDDITSESVTVKINEKKLKQVKRTFEYQFKLISKYGIRNISTESDSSIFDYPIKDLYPFTEYKLEKRLWVIAHSPRIFEEEYWSNWSETFFNTTARKPDRAPRTIPGAFSFKEQKDDRATIEVFWEPMHEYQWNGPGFRYNVSAVSDTGQWYFPVIDSGDSSSPIEVATFEDMKLDHYRILVSCSNHKGSFKIPNIMEIFPPKFDLKPKIKKVTNNRQNFNISWYPPTIQEDILNYTVMYCNLTTSSSCKDSIHFVTVPSTITSFSVTSPTVLNFAVSANYPIHSSDFSWQQCLVSSGADIGSPQFDLCNVTETSFDIRMTTACSSSSLYELLEVYVLEVKNGSEIWHKRFEQPEERISIEGLSADTEYSVRVVAFDELGNFHKSTNNVQTAPKFTKLQLTLFFLCGMLLISALTMGTTRKVNSLRNIHVEMPVALQTLFGMDEEESRMMLKPESAERTPRIYVDLPRKGYNKFSLVIPEEECDDGSSHEDELDKPENVGQHLNKVDPVIQAPEVSKETEYRNMPIIPVNNGYVQAAQFMTPRENPAPQLPQNVTNGTTSGYVVFK